MGTSIPEDLEHWVGNAIQQNLGEVDGLPDPAQDKIKTVYRRFFEAYLNIYRLKKNSDGKRAGDTIPTHIDNFDSDVVGYMQHFFSDYQNLYHEFIDLNRHCRDLMNLDPEKHPQAFDEALQMLLSGSDPSSDDGVLKALLSSDA